MTQSQYRTILLLSLVLGLLGGVLDLAIPSLVPDALRTVQEEYDAAMSMPRLVVAVVLGLPGVVLALAATYGLYRFRRWGPRTAVVGTVLSLLAWLAFGFSSQSGLAAALSYLASYLWGASIVLCYTVPYRSWFTDNVGAPASREA